MIMTKNSIKIVCNPYIQPKTDEQSIKYYKWDNSSEDWHEITTKESPFHKSEFTNTSIQHKAYEIIDNMNKIYSKGNVGLEIIFEGTKEDMEELQEICNKYFPKEDIQIKLGQRCLKSASHVKKDIECIFNKMSSTFKEHTNNKITELINKYSETVRPTIPICVMGLYSSGKSAFINSLIGVELLPSASDPTTAKIYKISSGKKYEIKFNYAEYGLTNTEKDKKIVLSFTSKNYKPNHSGELSIISKLEEIKNYKTVEEQMYHALSIINDYDMVYNKNKPHESQIWRISNLIEVTLPIELSILPFNDYDFIIYDTPGSNTANNAEHIEVLKQAMSEQTNGLPIFVTTPDSMDSEDNTKLIKTIDELGDALDKKSLMLIINKSDEKDITTLEKKNKNFNDLEVAKLNPGGTYFVSSVMGLGYKKLKSGRLYEDFEIVRGRKISIESPDFINADYKKAFKQNADGFGGESSVNELFKCNIIPRLQYDNYCSTDEPDDFNERIYRNSGIHSVESAIKTFSLKYAVYNKCRMTGAYLSDALDELQKYLNNKIDEKNRFSKELTSKMSVHQKEVLHELNKKSTEKKDEYRRDLSLALDRIIEQCTLNQKKIITSALNEIWKKTKGQKRRKYEATEKINIYLEQEIDNVWNKFLTESKDFWKIKTNDFKESLIKTIVDSPYLSEQQKNMIKTSISVAEVKIPYKSYKINKSEITTLFWFNVDKAEDKFMEVFENQVKIVKINLIDQSMKLFSRLSLDIQNQYQLLVTEHNPALLELRNKLEFCRIEIQVLEMQEEKIKENLNEITKLTEFEYF